MHRRIVELEQRRALLAAQVVADRQRLGDAVAGARTPLTWAARGFAIARYIRAHPALGGGLALAAGLVVRRIARGRIPRAAVVGAVLERLLRR